MRWEGQEQSDNVEDRRGMRMPGGPAGLGCGGVLLVLVIERKLRPVEVAVRVGPGGAPHPDAAPVRALQARQQPQGRGLARARGAEEHGHRVAGERPGGRDMGNHVIHVEVLGKDLQATFPHITILADDPESGTAR